MVTQTEETRNRDQDRVRVRRRGMRAISWDEADSVKRRTACEMAIGDLVRLLVVVLVTTATVDFLVL